MMLLLGMGFMAPQPVWAHALGADWSLKDGRVHIEAFFSDDSAAVNAKVEVLDSQDKIVAGGKTDGKGFWSFGAPAYGKYLVVVDAGAGHRVQINVTIPGAPQLVSTPSSENTEAVSGGTGRKDFTKFPYLQVGLGVGGIFLFSLAFLVARRKSRG